MPPAPYDPPPHITLPGHALLPRPATLDNALLIVRLRDTSMTGAKASLLALFRQEVSGAHLLRLPFRLRLRRPWPPGAQLSLEAELRWQTGRRLAPGDLLTTRHTPWRPTKPIERTPVELTPVELTMETIN